MFEGVHSDYVHRAPGVRLFATVSLDRPKGLRPRVQEWQEGPPVVRWVQGVCFRFFPGPLTQSQRDRAAVSVEGAPPPASHPALPYPRPPQGECPSTTAGRARTRGSFSGASTI